VEPGVTAKSLTLRLLSLSLFLSTYPRSTLHRPDKQSTQVLIIVHHRSGDWPVTNIRSSKRRVLATAQPRLINVLTYQPILPACYLRQQSRKREPSLPYHSLPPSVARHFNRHLSTLICDRVCKSGHRSALQSEAVLDQALVLAPRSGSKSPQLLRTGSTGQRSSRPSF
jgi:hypothetical protein